ncbi:MAG: glutamate ABC transporter substrate-binding protein [Pseudonocardiaceae bacterium]
MRLARSIAAGAALGVPAAVLIACSGSSNPGDSLVERADDAGTVTIGIRYDQPGLSKRTVDGRYVGFDVDVARFVAGELGVDADHITWHDTPAAERESAIVTGAVDFVVGTYSITAERKKEVDFARPYFETGQGLLVRLSTDDIKGPGSLNGKKLCSVEGSTSAKKVKERFAHSVELVEYPRYPDCVTALLARQVDAVTTDEVILAGYVSENPGLLKVVGKPFSVERYGIGLRKGDVEGGRALNDAITKMIASGEWRASLERNIGRSGYRIPEPPRITED